MIEREGKMKKYKVAVVGASGLVGRKMIDVLAERKFPVEKLYLFASAKSAGTRVLFNNKEHIVEELRENSFDRGIDIALFSAGGSVSEKFAPIAASKGTIVIDNSSAFRMDKDVPLIVPEVNPEAINNHQNIIANPNCSTIQSVVALKPIYDKLGIKRIIYTTYQAVSGAGLKGKNDLFFGLKGGENKHFQEQIAYNVIPQIDVPLNEGYYKEEIKMIKETRKIFADDVIGITATAVRVPVTNCHSIAINLTTKKSFMIETVREILEQAKGIVVVDDYKNSVYPTPLKANEKDEVFVGRIRQDFSAKNSLNLWCVADNIRKGAATNAVQIAELLVKKESVNS